MFRFQSRCRVRAEGDRRHRLPSRPLRLRPVYKRRGDMIQVTDDRMRPPPARSTRLRPVVSPAGLHQRKVALGHPTADPSINRSPTRRTRDLAVLRTRSARCCCVQTSTNYASNNYAALSAATDGTPAGSIPSDHQKYLCAVPQARVCKDAVQVFVKLRTNPFIKRRSDRCAP